MNPTQIAALAAYLQTPGVQALVSHAEHTIAQCLADGHDQQVADRLNLYNRPGFVPRSWVVETLSRLSMNDGKIRYILTFGKRPPPNQASDAALALYSFCQAVDRVARSSEGGLLLVADIDTAAGVGAISADFPAGFFTALKNGERKLSLAEENGLVLIGGKVTAADVGAAR